MATVDVVLAGFSAGTDQGALGLGSVLLVRGRNNILVDTGHHGRRRVLEPALKSRGLSYGDIHTVVLTHAHWDHVQNVDLFPKARFLIHPAELKYARSPRPGDFATAGYFAATLAGLNVHDAVEGSELEPGVRVIEIPGHSPATIGVLVDTSDGVAVIASDAFPEAGTVGRGRPYLVFWNEQKARESVRRIIGLGGVIYPGHDRPFRIRPDGSIQYLPGPTTLTITSGFDERDVGVGVTIGMEPVRQPWTHPEA